MLPRIAVLLLPALLAAAAQAAAQVALFTLPGTSAGDARAFAAGLGDLDGDGTPDFAVGAPNAGAGTLTIYSGDDLTVLGSLSGQAVGDGFGFLMAAAGDVTGTGQPTLLVGAPWHDGPNGVDAGRMYLYRFEDPNWNLLETLDGEAAGDEFGFSVARAGAVDGDPRDDVVVSAPRHDGPGGADAGRVYVFGDSGAGLTPIGAALDGPLANGCFGHAVHGAGDVDGDLRDDVVVGAAEASRAYVHAYSGGVWTQVWALQGDAASLFGASVRVAQLTADSVPDLVVGAPEDDSGGPDAGSISVFDGATGSLVYEATGDAALGYYYGYSLDVSDDVDGDGVADIVVGIPEASPGDTGAVRVLSGSTGATIDTLYGDAQGDGLGECVAALGDITGDGLPELLGGAPQDQPDAGYVRVYTGWSAIGSTYCEPAVSNSTGLPAEIHAFGSTATGDDDVTLVAVQLPPNQFGYFLNSPTAGFTANPGGSQGNLCLAGSIGRYSQFVGSSGDGGALTLTLALSQTPTPGGPVAIQAGETWHFQLWFRDLNPTTTSNFTNATAITFQ